jgi:hypothetical protein
MSIVGYGRLSSQVISSDFRIGTASGADSQNPETKHLDAQTITVLILFDNLFAYQTLKRRPALILPNIFAKRQSRKNLPLLLRAFVRPGVVEIGLRLRRRLFDAMFRSPIVAVIRSRVFN